jgi:ankyrin repeat protein
MIRLLKKIITAVIFVVITSSFSFASTHDDELIKAAVKGDYPAALIAVESGADINLKDKNGFTPLMISSNFGHERIVKLLIRRGADINLKAENGDTALSIAEAKKHHEIAELIKKKTIDLNGEADDLMGNAPDGRDNPVGGDGGADKSGGGPEKLSGSVNEGRSASKGAGPAVKSEAVRRLPKGLTREKREELNKEMLEAALKGDMESVENFFDEGADINARTHDGMTVLIFAVNQNSKDMYDFAIKNGADINICDASGNNALLCSFAKDNRSICEQLVSMGAIVDAKSEKTRDIFIRAVKNKDMFCAGFLVENKLDLKPVVIDEIPLLIYCVQKDMDDAAILFIKNGADVNAKDKTGKTVLMYASEYSTAEIIGLLKSGGADEAAKDSKGKTAAYYGSEDYKKDKFIGMVKGEIKFCRDYFINLMNAGAEIKNEAAAASYRECNAQAGYVSLIVKDDNDGLTQKRAPFSQPFNDRIAGLKKNLAEKNKDDKAAAASSELLNILTQFKEKSDKLDALISKSAAGGSGSGNAGGESGGIKENDVDDYINAYSAIKEDVEKKIAAVEAAAGIDSGSNKAAGEAVE